MNYTICLLPGDGIGVEVIAQTCRVLDCIGQIFGHTFIYHHELIGGCAIDQFGVPVTEAALAASKNCDAVLLGAVGGPKWDDPKAAVRPEQGLLRLRKELGVFANLRPVSVHPALIGSSPLKPERLAGVDILVVRELTGGLYFGQPKGRQVVDGHERAVDTLEYYDYEIRRVIRLAFQLARKRHKKVTSVDKANVLESSRLWRQIAIEVSAAYPDVTLEHVLVDTAAMRLVASPASFDVLVTENMFGDILTDEASVLAGSMGLLPSASLGNVADEDFREEYFAEEYFRRGPGLYEPIHGSAPDIAGKGLANPIGAILSAALMLRYSLRKSTSENLECEAIAIERAVSQAITDGCRTADLGGNLSTAKMADEIIERLPAGDFLGI